MGGATDFLRTARFTLAHALTARFTLAQRAKVSPHAKVALHSALHASIAPSALRDRASTRIARPAQTLAGRGGRVRVLAAWREAHTRFAMSK